MSHDRFKVVIYVPKTHEAVVKHAAFAAGAGRIGKYTDVSFTTPGTGAFTPSRDAAPAIGTPGEPEQVDEVRIEVTVEGRAGVGRVVGAVRGVHPYEEAVVDVYRLEEV